MLLAGILTDIAGIRISEEEDGRAHRTAYSGIRTCASLRAAAIHRCNSSAVCRHSCSRTRDVVP